MSENSGGGGAVTGDIVGLLSGFLEELRAHVLERIFEFNFLGDGNTVVGDAGGAELAIDRHVASLGSEGGGYRICNDIHAVLKLAAGFFGKYQLFSCHNSLPFSI